MDKDENKEEEEILEIPGEKIEKEIKREGFDKEGWKPKTSFKELVRIMVEADRVKT